MESGSFIISLDFELMWGVRDVTTIEKYGDSILGVRTAIPKILHIFNEFDIVATFSTVGFLFFDSKEELQYMLPFKKPNYKNSDLSPYSEIDSIGKNEKDDPYHYGMSLINLIRKENHEISTHTFCHYYCLEDGQSIDEFEEDLKQAIIIAKKRDIELKSIVFPRNQVNLDYLNICKKYGILSFRGNQKSWIYNAVKAKNQSLLKRFLRLVDSYVNISGNNIYDYKIIKETIPFNIPASAFLRPFNKRIAFLDGLRLSRIKNGMTLAAKNNRVFHLWWHPHNFGVNQNENLDFLKQILLHYKYLNNHFGFQSITMSMLSEKFLNNN
jgi:hypothetical protein